MTRTPLESSVLAAAGYDAAHAKLEIEFQSGDVYTYFAVPKRVFEELLASASKGKFFGQKIANTYPFEKH